MLAAQKMTPTRKTRREDSFDRSDDEEEQEDNGENVIGCLDIVSWGGRRWAILLFALQYIAIISTNMSQSSPHSACTAYLGDSLCGWSVDACIRNAPIM